MCALHKYLQFIGSGSYVYHLMNVQERDNFMKNYLSLRKVSFSLIFINPLALEMDI